MFEGRHINLVHVWGHTLCFCCCIYAWACVTSSDIMPSIRSMIIPCGILRYNTMERRCGQYFVKNCRCDVGLSVRCFAFSLRRSMCRPLKINVSTFKDRCVDLRRSMCRPSKIDDGCVDLRRAMSLFQTIPYHV